VVLAEEAELSETSTLDPQTVVVAHAGDEFHTVVWPVE
jgi:hypothetical protein